MNRTIAILIPSITLFFSAAFAHASERPIPYNEALVSDFITSYADCQKGKQVRCERTTKLCPLVTPKAAELNHFIWAEYPYKAKNGGMNIQYRFNTALKFCTA